MSVKQRIVMGRLSNPRMMKEYGELVYHWQRKIKRWEKFLSRWQFVDHKIYWLSRDWTRVLASIKHLSSGTATTV